MQNIPVQKDLLCIAKTSQLGLCYTEISHSIVDASPSLCLHIKNGTFHCSQDSQSQFFAKRNMYLSMYCDSSASRRINGPLWPSAKTSIRKHAFLGGGRDTDYIPVYPGEN
jgi:hypothetical protein